MNAEISAYRGNEITTIRVSQPLYQNMTDKKTTVNRRSKTEVSAWPVRKWRMFSSSRTRAMVSPTRRDSKYANGNANRWRNKRAPSSTSILLVVCAKTWVRSAVSTTSE